MLNDDVVIALFGDNFSILTTARTKEKAETAAQSVVNSVVIWSKVWKLFLNADKSEVCPFSTWSNTVPGILLFLLTHRKSALTLLLGVFLDRSLTFNAYLKKLSASLTSSIRIIRATAHTSRDWRRSTLKMAFHALVHNKLDYEAYAWQPCLSNTNLSCLDRLHRWKLCDWKPMFRATQLAATA